MRAVNFKQFKGLHKVKDITDVYDSIEILGTGNFGIVIKATHIKANAPCAVKRIRKDLVQKKRVYN